MIDEIFDADETALILVTGDFNAEEHETGPRIIAGAAEDTGNAELSARSLVILDRAMEPERRFFRHPLWSSPDAGSHVRKPRAVRSFPGDLDPQ